MAVGLPEHVWALREVFLADGLGEVSKHYPQLAGTRPRDEQARQGRNVANIQYASGRWLWCNRVAVRSVKVRLQ